MIQALHESNLKSLPFRHRGKVRDIYDVDARHMLIVTSDRLSAFDVVLPDPIPGKGVVLTSMSNFWFARTRNLIPNQLTDIPLAQVVKDPAERALLEGRAVVVRKLKAELAFPCRVIATGGLATLIVKHCETVEGVDDNLADGNRPQGLSADHKYNLYNQGWYAEVKDEKK